VPSRDPAARDPDVLPAAAAERLLVRASLLDAAQNEAVSVAHLRAAAAEAGISPFAFERALAEVSAGTSPAPAAARPSGRRGWPWITGAAAAALLALGALATAGPRPRADTPAGVATMEEAILLRCLSPGEAAELVRPLIRDGASVARWNPTTAPRVLTIRTTPATMQRVKALLAAHEGAQARTCPVPESSAPAP